MILKQIFGVTPISMREQSSPKARYLQGLAILMFFRYSSENLADIAEYFNVTEGQIVLCGMSRYIAKRYEKELNDYFREIEIEYNRECIEE